MNTIMKSNLLSAFGKISELVDLNFSGIYELSRCHRHKLKFSSIHKYFFSLVVNLQHYWGFISLEFLCNPLLEGVALTQW